MATRPTQRLEEKAAANDTEKKKPAVPAGALRPQDHKSAKADAVPEQVEVTFNFEGTDYTLVENAFEIAQDIDFLEQLQDQNLIGPVRTLIDFEQWAVLKEQLRPESGPLTQQMLRPFFELAMKELRAKNS